MQGTQADYYSRSFPPAAQAGAPLLLAAAFLGHACALRLLLHLTISDHATADINAYRACAADLLQAAAVGGHAATVRLLLSAFPGTATARAHGLLPIHWAAWQGKPEAVNALLVAAPQTVLAAVGDMPLQGLERGFTPLHCSCRSGNSATASTLLGAASVAALVRDSVGRLPAHTAAAGGHEQLLRLLLQVAPVAATAADLCGWTPATAAAAAGQAGALHFLLSVAPANARLLTPAGSSDPAYPGGQSLLHLACARGHVAAAALLLGAAPDLAANADEAGRTPLHVAAQGGHAEMARLLLARVAPPAVLAAARDSSGQLAIHRAAAAGHEAVVQVRG